MGNIITAEATSSYWEENLTLLNTVSWQPAPVAVSARSFVVRRLFYDLTSRRGCRATWFNNSKSRKAAKINSISGRWSALQRALHFYERAICSAGIKSVLAKHSCETVKTFRSAQRDNLSSKIKRHFDRNLWLLFNSLSLSGPYWVRVS